MLGGVWSGAGDERRWLTLHLTSSHCRDPGSVRATCLFRTDGFVPGALGAMKDLNDAEAEIKTTHELSDYTDESVGRYMAYTARLRTLLTSATRYIAYSSEVGEAFRPLARPAIVTAAYGISWAYIFGDVGYACYHAAKVLDPNDSSYKSDIAWVAARRATFQTLARYVPTPSACACTNTVKYGTTCVGRRWWSCADPFPTAAFTIHTVCCAPWSTRAD